MSATVEIIGTPFSTFTRTIAMALHEKGVAFIQYEHFPHSPQVLKHSPFGYIPAFVHNTESKQVSMFETLAISRYIDGTFGGVNLRPCEKDALGNAEVDKFISIASAQVFSVLEHNVIKPRLAAENEGLPESEIQNSLQNGVVKATKLLQIVEDIFQGPYVCGQELTWGDLFLYPNLADFKAFPEGDILTKFSKLSQWMKTMEERESSKLTLNGTLGSMEKPTAPYHCKYQIH
jgi:glutathione S-transferase